MHRIDLPPGWIYLNCRVAEELERELQQELCPEHVLYGVSARALARKQGRDDILFGIPDECFAQVHLTWSYEANPYFPSTEVFSSLSHWKIFLEEDELN